MEQMDVLLAQLRRLSLPGIAFSALLERHPPSGPRPRAREIVPKKPDCEIPLSSSSGLRASIASTAEQLAAATALVESRYAWRGYAFDAGGGTAPPGVTLVALQTGATMGTVTLRLDGPAGLAADEVYRTAIDGVRERGRRVCELTRLAIDSAGEWRATFGALFGLAYMIGRVVHNVTDVFVEVNPRHERFYQHMFGFVTVAARQICPRVKAPAVLLRLDVERLDARLAEFGLLTCGLFQARPAHALAA
jgi:hypothetical protein